MVAWAVCKARDEKRFTIVTAVITDTRKIKLK